MAKSANFNTQTFGKCIITGEHAVLRGAPALIYPLRQKKLNLSWQPGDSPLEVRFQGVGASDTELVFWALLERALQKLGRSRTDLLGRLNLNTNIPLGSGLGASAALCVAVSQWMKHLDWLEQKDIYEFSCRMEDLFHGESSGVDIAVNIAGQPIRFERGGEWQMLHFNWHPHWCLSFSGTRGSTVECVRQVKELKEKSPELFLRIDDQMKEASLLAEKALVSEDEDRGLLHLAESFQMANDCFRRWNLIPLDLEAHMDLLKKMGAVAVKPTGSGGGGHVLSLWPKHHRPPDLATRL